MAHQHHGHCHHHHPDLKGKKLMLSILLNTAITLSQIVGGIISGSLSLISDALHNLSDVISLALSYVANRLTQREYTHETTYGYKRAEIMAAFINAVILIGVALFLVKEAFERLYDPIVIDSTWVIVLAILGIAVNGGSVLLLRKEAKDNMNIEAASLHLFFDMVTSVAVLLGGVAIYTMQVYWVDSVLSVLIAIYLVYSSLGLVIRTLKILMQFAPQGIDLNEIQQQICKLPAIASIHHFHLWQLNDQEIHCEARVDFEEDLKLSEVCKHIREVENILRDEFNIHHVTLQAEYGCTNNKALVFDERKHSHTHAHSHSHTH
ncbi:cation diffusion facilitator family transporter [Candidatus Uabimicrobium amorphum]|uniref:Cobalt transporter n=1 Tax=Uabimicrobium amorphum TaxID=2596890 RepID=A0A5S9F652_UABAM|nr:cation diffusion facilitator family transporter [Candidatus Uabimicrobium amorphum]BBM85962.1 cobalt transporter [Candidatus Uabimicrobium amorphum]